MTQQVHPVRCDTDNALRSEDNNLQSQGSTQDSIERFRLRKLWVLTAMCAAAAAAAVWFGPRGDPSLAYGSILLVATAVLEWTTARSARGSQQWFLSLTEVVLVSFLVSDAGTWVAVPGALGMLVAQHLRRVRSPSKRAFNVSMYALIFASAGGVAAFCGGGLLGAAAGGVAFWVPNCLIAAVAVRVYTGQPLVPRARAMVGLSALHALINVALGLLAGAVAVNHPMYLLGLAVPLVLIFTVYEYVTRQDDQVRLLNSVLHGHRTVREHPTEEAAQVVLLAIGDLFSTRDTTMIVLRGSDEPLRVSFLDSSSDRPHLRIGTSADLDQGWVLSALASPKQLLITQSLAQSTAVLRIGGREDPLAVVIARKRGSGSCGISQSDSSQALKLGHMAEQWLREAATEGPSNERLSREVIGLRSAIYRLLSRATDLQAGSGNKPVHGADVASVVAELHRVERATAGVIGASADTTCRGAAAPLGTPLAGVAPALAAAATAATPVIRWISLPAQKGPHLVSQRNDSDVSRGGHQ